jgi:Cytochrome C biogenesis protein transmembrane region
MEPKARGMSGISDIGLLSAFLAGLVSFLSPCVLPLVPGYVSFVSGAALGEGGRGEGGRLSILSLALCFVVGFSTVFIALGASATAISQLLLQYRYEANLAGGAIVMLFGAFMTGLIPMRWLQRDLRFHSVARSGPADRGLCARARVRIRVDAMHRTDPRRHPNGQRAVGYGVRGSNAARRLFARSRSSLSRHRHVHGHYAASPKGAWQGWGGFFASGPASS